MASRRSQWELVPIAHVLQPLSDGRLLHQGWSPRCETRSADPEEWGVLKTTAIQFGDFIDAHNKALPPGVDPDQTLEVRPNDLLITCAGPRARCGITTLVRTTRAKLMISGKMYRFRANDEVIHPEFLEACLLSPPTVEFFDSIKTGGDESGLNFTQDRFFKTLVWVAPYFEQTRIVKVLRDVRRRAQSIRTELQHLPTQVNQLRQSILNAAFRGDLTADWRQNNPDVEPASVLLDRIRIERRKKWEETELAKRQAKGKAPLDDRWKQKYVEPAFTTPRELPDLPETWATASIEETSEWVTDGEHQTPPRTDDGVPLLSARNVGDGHLSLENIDRVSKETFLALCKRLHARRGDVLLSCSGSVGRSCVVETDDDLAFVRSVAIIRPLINSFCLSFALRSTLVQEQIRAASTQTAQANIFQGKIKALVIRVPPLSEEQEIVNRIRSAFDHTERVRVEVAKVNDKLDALQAAILAKAFRGELVSQDPNEEPASALLARKRLQGAESGARSKGKLQTTAVAKRRGNQNQPRSRTL